MMLIDFLRSFDWRLDRFVSEGTELDEMLGMLIPVLDLDARLLELNPFDADHRFVDDDGEFITPTEDERVRMNEEQELIKKSMRTIYEVLFQKEYGSLNDSGSSYASLLVHSEDESSYTVRVWKLKIVLDFEAGYYWTFPVHDRRELEFKVHDLETNSHQDFHTFKDLICYLCRFVGNERLADIISNRP